MLFNASRSQEVSNIDDITHDTLAILVTHNIHKLSEDGKLFTKYECENEIGIR